MNNLKQKFRLYPNQSQIALLTQIIGANRFVWNHFLQKEMEEYDQNNKFRFLNTNSRDLTALKQTLEWLKEVPSTSLQQTLINLDRAIKQSSKRSHVKRGFPKFKTRKNFEGSFSLTMVNAKKNIQGNRFYIPKVGLVRMRQHRPLISDFASCQIKREGTRWFVVLTVVKPTTQLPITNNTVGVDLNSRSYALSTGAMIEIPKFLRESQGKIRNLQRQLSRKVKGSRNRLKTQLKLYKVYQRIRDKRMDFFHKLSTSLVTMFDTISLENLDVKSIQQRMGRVIQDNGFALFRAMIEYKALLYGKTAVIINRYFPSSQLCSNCNGVQKLQLTDRIYDCPSCELILDRDLNAAINIDRAGTAQIGITSNPNAFGEETSVINKTILMSIFGILTEEGSLVL